MNKKILFVIHRLNYGGAEKILTFVANGLNRRGYKVFVYTFEDIIQHYLLDVEVIHDSEKNICKVRGLRRFVQLFQIRREIRSIQPDLVISFLSNPNLLCILATLCSKTPVIISERGDPTQGNGIISMVGKYIYRFADGAVFQTNNARDYFAGKLAKKSCVIPNPVTINCELKKVSKRNNEIAFVGRFELRQKRQDLMLLAFRKVVNVYPEMKLVFYGDGDDEKKVRDMVEHLNLSDNVRFAGLVKNVYEYICGSRMLVLTSDYEGIPNALIEAMAVGLPVVATDCSPGGARMLIDHQINGLLVPKGDVEAIANAIIFIIGNEEIANKYGLKAMGVTNRFAPKGILDMWENYINKIIGEKK
jgi:GalNAc-alpha-(1->4)-GalNAc-alpha-(1->3)-diNAcBac-PP-undecaprenol alpha-1,4-N-acetyl-D-galactosaminyltransferase